MGTKKELNTSVIFTIVLVAAVGLAVVQGRPRYIECTNSFECGIGFCCVLGMGKYSIPRCLPLSDEHRPCGAHGTNTTVYYPDGARVELTNIFLMMCPCADGLVCSQGQRTCQDPYESLSSNAID